MKNGATASNSGSVNGVRYLSSHPFRVIWILAVSVLLTGLLYSTNDTNAATLQQYRVRDIRFKSENRRPIKEKLADKFRLLIDCKGGELFSYAKNRKSIENLYKTGLFENIEAQVEKINPEELDIIYMMTPRYRIRAVKIIKSRHFKASQLLKNIYSLRKNSWFEAVRLEEAEKEIRNFLTSRGYFNPDIKFQVLRDEKRATLDILFNVDAGKKTMVNNLSLTVPDDEFFERIKEDFILTRYVPFRFRKRIEKLKEKLKKQKYYFPQINIEETFLDEPKKSKVNLNINIKPGFRYQFKFEGIGKKLNLVASIWEKKVFEKWAEKESNARILYHLRNKGYLNAEVNSSVTAKGLVKHITFRVKKNKKYKLGKITFSGNAGTTDKELERLALSDDLLFDRFFHVRFNSLRVDQEVLRLSYYFKGFPLAGIATVPTFRDKKVDIDFKIREGKKYTVDTILFNGNQGFGPEVLGARFQTKPGGPFVQQKLNEDLERLRNFYFANGYDDVEISQEISPGTEKSILVTVREGTSYRLGNLIVIGASSSQQSLLQALFPLKTGVHFNRLRIEAFQADIENSSIFNEFKLEKIKKSTNVIDVLVKVSPDRGNYYGFGLGWELSKGAEDQHGLRGTLEYQQRNIFNTYSSFSTLLQSTIPLDKKIQTRGVISFETPYLFRRKLDSQLKLWADSEIFPSYETLKFGISESLIKRLTLNSYVLTSLSWYSTVLTQLEIPVVPGTVDQVSTPFYTSALQFLYVNENRDDPFNPTRGSFFSANLKMGLLMYEHYNAFVKFRWSYQKIFKLLKKGTLAFSVRNGLAQGELSITERFFAGGVNTFRGAKTDRLGPRINDEPIGGNALVLFNLEATFPIPLLPGNDFYYAVFADMGNVFDKLDDIGLGHLEKAIGFGLRFKTQLGPLRVDFAWNLEDKPGSNFQFQIGIGNVL